jgi:flavin-dependent dehydrogenase
VKTITIIGGGLAGLALGIGLRRREVPVRLLEAGTYPRHRICGEFISGRGLEALRLLGVRNFPGDIGAREAQNVALYADSARIGTHQLPSKALSISRFILDQALANAFLDAGGKLECGVRWTGEVGEGTVMASGRRRHMHDRGVRWFGIKVHTRDVPLEADLEMHLFKDRYVGLCQLADGTVNVCGLFRGAGEAHTGDALKRLCGPGGSALHARLTNGRFDTDSLCSVAGFSFERAPFETRECRIGDALTMIPPVTGNGMSIAFESAALAVEPLADYAFGRRTWGETTAAIADSLSKRLSTRLFWAGAIHRLIFSKSARWGLALARWRPIWRGVVGLTR